MTHDQISRIAYRLWQERGCPEGSPEIDWTRAEAEVVSTSLVESESLGEVPTLESEVVLRGELTPAKSQRRRRQDSVL